MGVNGEGDTGEPEYQTEDFQEPVRSPLELPDQDLEEGDVQEGPGCHGRCYGVAHRFGGVARGFVGRGVGR